MRRGLVKPSGKTRKTGTGFLHAPRRFRRHQLGPLGSEQIGKIEQEELYLVLLGKCFEFPNLDYKYFPII